jgi:hypothetical protein
MTPTEHPTASILSKPEKIGFGMTWDAGSITLELSAKNHYEKILNKIEATDYGTTNLIYNVIFEFLIPFIKINKNLQISFLN